jgi:hypothetical protein
VSTCTGTPVPRAQTADALVDLLGPSHGTIFGTTASGTLYAFGGAFDEPFTNVAPPQQVAVPPVRDAHVSGVAACVVTVDGDVLCWGGNDLGQMGRGQIDPVGVTRATPTSVTWR